MDLLQEAAGLDVQRHPLKLTPDPTRVLARPFRPGGDVRGRRIVERVLAMDDERVGHLLRDVCAQFDERHPDLEELLTTHYQHVRHLLPSGTPEITDPARRQLTGAYFTMEYAVESAALFNPSIVPHPDQTGLREGALRFVMSLRATGEGHISAIAFARGTLGPDHSIAIDERAPRLERGAIQLDATYERPIFDRKLMEMGHEPEEVDESLRGLGRLFTLQELRDRVEVCRREGTLPPKVRERLCHSMLWLAESNYEMRFDADSELSARVLFPYSASEQAGMEDARFVRFEDDGRTLYYATYTAYDGRRILPQLIETEDFLTFRIHTLNGDAIEDKGMALFPRTIGGRYHMIGRQDGESLFLMTSYDPYFWNDKRLILRPDVPWALVQMGNCGSPIETDEGWLLLTHGVGPMREYCLGAVLLDLDNPARVIGRLRQPLLSPTEEEREGYVPNVVYTCGALVHRGRLVIPYAMSDQAITFATADLDALLAALKNGG